jgi:UDP-glucose 4-epimerase
VHADTRHAAIAKLIRQLRIDTVVHMALSVDSAREDRAAHETNVIGTMNVLTGCTGTPSRVERLVVKSSQAIYDAGPSDPSFFSEDMVGPERQGSFVTRDLREMEQLVGEFALRNPHSIVTTLRLGYRVTEGTTLAKYLSLPIVPTFAGFDPRLQLLHEEDAAESIVRSVIGIQPGVFNVAGSGVVLLSQAIAIMGGHPAPVLLPYGRWMARFGLRSLTGILLPGHLADVLAFGSVADCGRLAQEFAWRPAYTTRAVMDSFARGKDAEVIEAPSPPQEYELQVFLQRRRRQELRDRRAGSTSLVTRQ